MVSREDLQNRFGAWDYMVFVGMLSCSAAIGIYYACSGGKQQTTKEFLWGNRSMKVVPVSLSIMATFLSAIALLGTPSEIYLHGTQYAAIMLACVIMMPLTAYLFLPVFYDLQLNSVFEYLNRRFNRIARTFASALFSIHMMIYMAIVLYAPSLALSQVTGLHVWFSVLSIGVVCTFYTTIGGIKAVVWTDVFQTVMMYVAMCAIVIKGIQDQGGFNAVWQRNIEGQRIEFFNINPDPTVRHTLWGLSVGGTFSWIAIYGVNQAMVQRYLSIPTLRGAQTAIWLNLPLLIALLSITCLAGLVIYAKYFNCDPMLTHQVNAPDQLFPLFVMDTLGFLPGVPGLFVSGIFSGALSTVSSGVNSLAAVTLEDIIKGFLYPNLSETSATRITKVLAVVYGIIAILLVVVAQNLGNVLQAAFTMSGVLASPVLGLFVLGMFFPYANTKGALIGTLTGFCMSLWIGIGMLVSKPYIPKLPVSVDGCMELYANVTEKATFLNSTASVSVLLPVQEIRTNDDIFILYRLSYIWFSTIGCCTTILAGLLFSFITGGPEPEKLDSSLFSPIVRTLFASKLSPSLKEKLNGSAFKGSSDNSNDLQRTIAEKPPFRSGRSDKKDAGVINIAFIGSSESQDDLRKEKETKVRNQLESKGKESRVTPL